MVGLLCEAVGVVSLKKGLEQVGKIESYNIKGVARFIKAAATSKNILVGMVFETIFFISLMTLISKGTVSFVWPLSSLGLVFTTLAARVLLKEDVSTLRWMGVLLMVIGAGVITYTESLRDKNANPAQPVAAATSTLSGGEVKH